MNKIIKYSALFAAIFTIYNGLFGLRVSAGVPEEALGSVVRILVVNYGSLGEVNDFKTLTGLTIGESGKSVEYFLTYAGALNESLKGKSSEIYILLDDDAVSFKKQDDNYYDGESDVVKIDENTTELDINPTKAIKCDIVYSGDYDEDDDSEKEPDVAILRTIRKVKNRDSVRLLYSKMVGRGSKTYAVGFTSEESEFEADPKICSVSSGNITKIAETKKNSYPVIEVESKKSEVEPGGPVFTEDGAVIGINTGELTKKGKSLYRYYIISSDYIGKLLSSEGIEYAEFGEDNVTDSNKKSVPVGIIIAIVIMTLAIIAVIIVAASTAGSGKKKDSKIKQAGQYVKIACMGGALNGLVYIIGETPVTIGRSSDCDIVYPNDTFGISRRHVRLYTLKNRLYITDLGSTAGTQIIGIGNISANRSVEIGLYQKFCLGDITNVFEVLPYQN